MPGKLVYERYNWFHGQVKNKLFPNANKLACRFEISRKQAQRDIEFMRDRLNAPLNYIPDKRGYTYDNLSYELPPIWIKEEEFLSLCLALRLAAALPDKRLKGQLYALLNKFVSFRSLDNTPRMVDIEAKVSIKNIQYYRVKDEIFQSVVGALLHDSPLLISYYSPHTDEATKRTILPLHLLCYMGSWHIIAFCTLRGRLRDFALSRIAGAATVNKKIDLPENPVSVKEFIRKNFGILSGEDSVEVCLKFTPDVSRWVKEQIWHSAQEFSKDGDGGICLKFPVADFREVKREILKFGASVEVLSPPELRDEIKEEIEKMTEVYR